MKGRTRLHNFDHVRGEKQRRIMEEFEAKGLCPFCRENLQEAHPREILREGKFWVVTENMNPYRNARVHILLIYSASHIESRLDIPPEAHIELAEMERWVVKKFKMEGHAFLMRSGDNRFNGGSVNHLHAQIVCGTADPEEPVRTKIG